jgi:hypothetical protein
MTGATVVFPMLAPEVAPVDSSVIPDKESSYVPTSASSSEVGD